ncbi:hypothetical protein BHM03_00047953 [Ensete ventricosum]|nr:hypothetical protein BHM03_00047953 [Ensete ventricosum]
MGAGSASRALSITPFIISRKGSHYSTNTILQKDMSNKMTYIISTCETTKCTCANMK